MYQILNPEVEIEEQGSEPPSISGVVETSPKSTISPPKSRVSSNWNDWKWQIKNRIRTLDQLSSYYPSLHNNGDLTRVIQKYPMAITPYYASLIQRLDSSDPVFRMSIPQLEELINPPCLSEDPLEEHKDMPVPGLVHRYPDRALVIVTTTCASYCRHCTRKRIAGTRECSISPRRIRQITEYLLNHPEISDVVISGGDPLTMADETIEAVLSSIRSVPTVQVIRFGSRVPVVMPMRITDELVSMLRKYHPIWINTHFNHPNELTAEAREACNKLADAGIPLGNQTVLLRGVNDSPQIIERLCRGLVSMRVRPYYLYQCDLVRGVEHFRTPLSRGIEIMEYMRGRVSGIAIPTFVVDAAHGGGKIPVMPTYVVSTSPTHTVFRNYEGLLVNYPEPGISVEDISSGVERKNDQAAGVWELATGRGSIIQPADTSRNLRRQKICETKKSAPTAECGLLFEV
ncbi:MAG: KamA family radical SAM protein [Candidatus Brocadiia bacterium]|nr:MAG: KamA family radical SAM protein [Candidatus Brocadiia bacterium]